METQTKETGTETKIFKSGQGAKPLRYWKDRFRHYRIINEREVAVIYISRDKKETSVSKHRSSKGVSSFFRAIVDGNKRRGHESTEEEYKTALKIALKIINK